MASITEIIIFDTSDKFREDPGILIPAFDIALEAKGAHVPAYYGLQIEGDGAKAYLFFNWDSFEAHKAMMDAPYYPTVIEKLMPCLKEGSKPDMLHIEFSAPTIALSAPITKVAVVTLKSPDNREAVVGILSEAGEKSLNLIFGKTREDENKYIVICGLDKEDTSASRLTEVLQQLSPLINEGYHLNHTKLLRHPL